ncbi:MAG: UDP-N-acetylmuramoyl-L-alanyl-D-glutamate--2,6-diaminopimelate ligase [candidate division Zixibacteria bacterium]|nr:UDP-N-acetylmuramoyl-L-alanyl-D-glutamate--2,6-diaminopimelate ligase [candidate division Zixibacteria bacterium]
MIQGLESIEVQGDIDLDIDHIEYDSRLIKENGLFLAVKGFQQDGYDYVQQALDQGAVAVMGEREECDQASTHIRVPNIRQAMAHVAAVFYGHPGSKIKAIGVTGTNGKTTVCHLIKRILEKRNKTAGLICSTVYDTGKETFPAERTTPEALDLQRLLFLMKKNYCVNAVIEVSSHALSLHRVDQINFRVAVYTNISRDHLDFHGTMEEYLETKAKLMKKLEGPLSYAVINLDVPEFRSFFGDFSSSYISYSLENTSADVHCANYEINPDGTVFNLVTPMGTQTVSFPLPGRFNLINALCSAAAGLACGVDLDNVIAGLEDAQPVPGRFVLVNHGQPFGVIVDFAHTPDALERLCQSVRELTDERLLILFGCGGDRDKGKRPLMGRAATTGADFAVVTSDNPRGEDPAAIIEDIKPGLQGKNYEICLDRKKAIKLVLEQAQPGDIVLLAGKGCENYQEIKGTRTPFDDSAEARAILSSMGYQPEEILESS